MLKSASKNLIVYICLVSYNKISSFSDIMNDNGKVEASRIYR